MALARKGPVHATRRTPTAFWRTPRSTSPGVGAPTALAGSLVHAREWVRSARRQAGQPAHAIGGGRDVYRDTNLHFRASNPPQPPFSSLSSPPILPHSGSPHSTHPHPVRAPTAQNGMRDSPRRGAAHSRTHHLLLRHCKLLLLLHRARLPRHHVLRGREARGRLHRRRLVVHDSLPPPLVHWPRRSPEGAQTRTRCAAPSPPPPRATCSRDAGGRRRRRTSARARAREQSGPPPCAHGLPWGAARAVWPPRDTRASAPATRARTSARPRKKKKRWRKHGSAATRARCAENENRARPASAARVLMGSCVRLVSRFRFSSARPRF